MPIRFTCPECDTQNTVSDDKRGTKVPCKECKEPCRIPAKKSDADAAAIQDGRKVKVATRSKPAHDDDDRDDEELPIKKKKSKSGSISTTLVIGGVAAVLLLCLVGAGGVGGIFLFRSRTPTEPHLQVKAVDHPPENKVIPEPPPSKKALIDPGKKPIENPPVVKPIDVKLPPDLPIELVPTIKQATVYLRITMPSGAIAEGSGFFALEPGIVVTNAHVLGMLSAKSPVPRTVQVVVNSGEANERAMAGEVLGVDRASDLAVVRVNQPNLPNPLQLETKHQATELQKVYIFGFPFGAQLGKNITVSNSSISSVRRDPETRDLVQIQVNGGMHAGNSGGPVVNALGNVVGVSVAGIKGTQINFAVPAEKVQLIMEGRLADASHGEAYLQGAQAMLPVSFTCLDPLNRVQNMGVEVWAGVPGPPRAYSLEKPTPLPSDRPRQAHRVPYQNFAGKLDVPLPPLDGGQVYWVQPVITTKAGSTHWGVARPMPTSLIPIERMPANLQVSLTAQKERTVRVKGVASDTFIEGKRKVVSLEAVNASYLEVLYPDKMGASVAATMNSFKMSAEEDGQPVPLDPQIDTLVSQRPPRFIIDGTNKLRQRIDVTPNTSPQILNEFKFAYQQLCNSLEGANLPMPNRMVQPREQWSTQLPMMVKGGAKPIIVDLALQCTLEGTRQRNTRSEAVISVRGNIQGRDEHAKSTGGDVTGKIAFDLAGGFIAQAELTISSQIEIASGEAQLIYAFNISLNREPGNPMNLPLPTEPKGAPEPPKGNLVAQWAQALTPQDPFDPKGQQSRMKFYDIPMQAGVTYVISMNSDAFDTYLRLYDRFGKQVAEDDDGGGNLNARIIYRPAQAGVHRIVATSFKGNSFGPFQLSVTAAAGEKKKASLEVPRDMPAPHQRAHAAQEPIVHAFATGLIYGTVLSNRERR